jgi:endoglucanase
MLACHIDEIGFYVRYTTTKAIFACRTSADRHAQSRPPRARPGRKDLIGVLNPTGRPIHMATDDEKKTYTVGVLRRPVSAAQEGQPTRTDRRPVADSATGGSRDVYTGKCLDNRIATYVAITALRRVGKRSKYDIYYAATVQEEAAFAALAPAPSASIPTSAWRSTPRFAAISPASSPRST